MLPMQPRSAADILASARRTPPKRSRKPAKVNPFASDTRFTQFSVTATASTSTPTSAPASFSNISTETSTSGPYVPQFTFKFVPTSTPDTFVKAREEEGKEDDPSQIADSGNSDLSLATLSSSNKNTPKGMELESALNDDSSDAVPHDIIAGQKFLNKLILTKISAALNQDLAADLTALLSDVSTSYPSKRRKAAETRTSTRKGEIPVVSTMEHLLTSYSSGRVSDSAERGEKPTTIPLPPKLEILYPLAPAALAAIGLSDASSETEIESALIQFPRKLEQGEILHNLFGRQIIGLDSNVVVKCGPKIDPAEHFLLEYLQIHCPTMRSPEPLGFFVLDHKPHLFMTRIKGVTLHTRWPSMSLSQKASVCSKLDTMLTDLHAIPWTPGVPLGSLIPPYICKDARLHVRTGGPIYNEAEFNDFLFCTPLKSISSSYLKWLRSCLRDDHQIVLSHGDLNTKNIILLDEQDGSISISGIIDWEMGGWYPEYWDALKVLNVRSTNDESDWWCSLPEQLNRYVSEVAINHLVEISTTGM